MSDTFFKWDQTKYSIHVNHMDDEHKVLINYMNDLYQKNEKKSPKDELKKSLITLADYTKKHFKDEEEFFSKLPDYHLVDAHKKIHADLLQKFQSHVDTFEKTGTLTVDFFLFLKVWLTAHIAGIDMKYGEIANKKAS